ncbi:hypothetical protein [Flavobacterium collinsii]|uniref:Lipoprotein n=1 Tax=Flavobacterium collinsii TaxID=1114861 RepID=A0A9W4X4P6_9FLAO|nr:hypothetical protein [Flavobacterium collinsii]CAI2768702.1 conserved protein of unknown function [Flavobacterium collinsii]
MKTKASFISIASLIFFISCKGPKPIFSNLHHQQFRNDSTNSPIIDVRVGILTYKVSPQPEEKTKQLWELQDSLPHHLLKVISSKTKEPEKIIALMSKPINPKKDSGPTELPTEFTEYKVRLAFSNIKRYFINKKFTHPNTRLAYLNTYISIPSGEDRVAFKSIDKLENEFEEVDLGNLSRSNTVTFNSKLTATGQIGSSIDNTNTVSSENSKNSKSSNEKKVYDEDGNAIGTINNSGDLNGSKKSNITTTSKNGASANVTGEIGYVNTETLNEARLIKLQRMKAGFSFSPNEIVVSQEGRQNADISLNVFVDATLKFNGSNLTDEKNVYTFQNLFDDSYQPVSANDLSFVRRTVSYVKCNDSKPLLLNVQYEGELRAVENLKNQTGENALEFDDKVTMYHLPLKHGSDAVIDPMLFCKYVYRISAKDPLGNTIILNISWKKEEELDLFSDDKPEEFLRWLKLQIAKENPKTLSTNKFEIYFKVSHNEKIYVVKDKMTSEDFRKLKQLTDLDIQARS